MFFFNHLLVIRYSLEELRRIFVDEKTLIESKDPINPEKRKKIKMWEKKEEIISHQQWRE